MKGPWGPSTAQQQAAALFVLSISALSLPLECSAQSSPLPSPPAADPALPRGTVVGIVFGCVIFVSFIMVSIVYWVKSRKLFTGKESGDVHGVGRSQSLSTRHKQWLPSRSNVNTNTNGFTFSFGSASIGATPTRETKSAGTVPLQSPYPVYGSATVTNHQQQGFNLSRHPSLTIPNAPAMPYQIPFPVTTPVPATAAAASTTSLQTIGGGGGAASIRTIDRPVIRSHQRTTSDVNKDLPNIPFRKANDDAVDNQLAKRESGSSPPLPPLHFVAFPGSTIPHTDKRHSPDRLPSASSAGPSRALPTIPTSLGNGRSHHPYAPFAEDYRSNDIQRRPSDSAVGGAPAGATGSLNRFVFPSSATPNAAPPADTQSLRDFTQFERPRSQSLSSLQYGNPGGHGAGGSLDLTRGNSSASATVGRSIYANPEYNNSTASVRSFYRAAVSTDGLASAFDETPLSRPESRSNSLRSKKYENQLWSR